MATYLEQAAKIAVERGQQAGMRRESAQSLALHLAIAEKLRRASPGDRVRTLNTSLTWARESACHEPRDPYMPAWIELIEAALASMDAFDLLLARCVNTDEHSIDMRQSTPWPGVLSQVERMAVLEAFWVTWDTAGPGAR